MTLGVRLTLARGRRPRDMRSHVITCVLLACVWFAAGDVAHLKAAKARLLGRLAGKHHKRGIYSAVPPFKLGHDIPHVTHSVVKPLVVTYPPTASVAAVKVPVHPPYSRFPSSVAHKGHTHFGSKFHHHKTVLVPKPDQHFHHHHHHVEPKPIVPVLPAPPVVPPPTFVPIPQPTNTIVRPVPAPSPPVLVHQAPQPIFPAPPVPVAPPPIPLIPQPVPLKPLVPLTPIQPTQAVNIPAFPLAAQFPYVIRPGNAVQTSYYATYPRYPLVNYQSPLLPFAGPPAPLLPAGFYDRPHFHHLQPQAGVHGVFEQPPPSIAVEQTPNLHPIQTVIPQPAVHLQPAQPPTHLHPVDPSLHLQPAEPSLHLHPAQPTLHIQPSEPTLHVHPAQPSLHVQPVEPTLHLQPTQPTVHLQPTQPVPLDHNGWSPVPSQHDHTQIPTEGQFQQPLDSHHFTQEQGTQVYEHHTGNDQFHDYQNHLQHHIHQQIEQSQYDQAQYDQAQYDQQFNNQHQLNQDYGAPQQEYGQPNQDFQQNQEFAQHAHEYAQHVQEYAQHGQDYAQTNEYQVQQGQGYHPGQEYGQPEQEYNLQGQEYQGIEGRSGETEDDAQNTQRYHNHIPLGLQPPIDRPLEHFR
ncbi:hypothetical protein evm_011564 [Chilo suppressalis]|nr:hypothetical protein evm_011564 [Chilo suppressalis]